MSVVAVAGGTGSIGRTVVEEIVADGQFEAVILSRKTLGARILVADYSNVDSLAALLEDNQVQTVISALGGRTPPENEHALIQASDKSNTTKRYIPSVWGVKYPREVSWFPIAAAKHAAFDALDKTSLEWTIVANGFFLDYWGMPSVKSYLEPLVLIVDLAAQKAAIPGSGDTPVVFAYTRDVAKFTAKLLTLKEWDPESYVIGDRLTWNEFVKIAEELRGEEFEVVHDSLELLEAGKVTELPSHVPAYQFFPKEALQGLLSQFGRLFDLGVFDFQPQRSLNSLFPEIKTVTIKEMLEIGIKN